MRERRGLIVKHGVGGSSDAIPGLAHGTQYREPASLAGEGDGHTRDRLEGDQLPGGRDAMEGGLMNVAAEHDLGTTGL